jgi:hypothetical protein
VFKPNGGIEARDNSWVTYRHLSQPESVGHKRMVAAAIARGKYIVHWCEHDLYAPTRVADQVQPLVDQVSQGMGLACGVGEEGCVWVGG